MALSLKDPDTDRLARALATLTGETLTEAIRKALAERLERERVRRGHPGGLAGRIREIGEHCAALPNVSRSATDAALGRDAAGMWRRWWSMGRRCSPSCSGHRMPPDWVPTSPTRQSV
jgi:antitoxin VapB